MAEHVIYLVRSWPRLSQTFIVNEVLALERRGLTLTIFSLVRSGEDIVQPQVARVRAPVRFLADARRRGRRAGVRAHLAVARVRPARWASCLLWCLLHPGQTAGYGATSVLDCFAHAVEVTAAVDGMRSTGDRATHVHAHFAHDPALVGMLVAKLTGLPFTFTAHARDLVQLPSTALTTRAGAATAVVTCCAVNAEYIRAVVPARVRPPVLVVHHGIELSRFTPTAQEPVTSPTVLVSTGRLVEKKGYADLLHALARVDLAGRGFTCRVYGDGPLREDLLALRDRLGLVERVVFVGARGNDEVRAALAAAHVFVLTPRVAEDGDRDGIPNALVEAMACGLPVVTTAAGGITELVEDGLNGLVAAPGAIDAIAGSLERLLPDDGLRRRLGANARRTVETSYDVDTAACVLDQVLHARRRCELGVGR